MIKDGMNEMEKTQLEDCVGNIGNDTDCIDITGKYLIKLP